MKFFTDSIFYSYSQIFLSNRKWFGIVALLSTMINYEIGLMGLAGGILTNLIALFLKFDKEKIKKGFYGFNGILFSAAVPFFFELTIFTAILAIIFIFIAFFTTAVLEHYFASAFNLPGLSVPFIITLFIFFVFITNFDEVHYSMLSFDELPYLTDLPLFVKSYFKSLSLIVLQPNIISGVFIAIAIVVFSRVMFINSLLAFSANFLILTFLFPNYDTDQLIITSFNSILVSFALGGSLIILSRKTPFLIILESVLVIVFTAFFFKILTSYVMPVLVIPFNLLVLVTLYSLKFREEHSELTLLYFQPGSPEENYYYHKNRKSRFDKFKYLFPELPFFGEWFITQAFEGEHTHKDNWKYAWDFEIKGENGKLYQDEGKFVTDYFCYNTPVVSPLEGEVVRIFDNVQDNKIGNTNIRNNWGNTVIVDHGKGLFSALSHLKPNSIKVKKGDLVKKGQILALCGSSGRSPVPHLHFQFQLTDKIGDKTYKFPFAQYLEKENGLFSLKTFDYPKNQVYIKNIETHQTLKNSFNFQIGEEFEFDCELNGKKFTEKWSVEVDILNVTYIISDNGATAVLYPTEKIFYMANFIGNKSSALYHFYLLSIRVPLGYQENLYWEDEYPLSVNLNNFTRYLSELFLIYTQLLTSKTSMFFSPQIQKSEDFEINSKIIHQGKGLFSFYKKEAEGKLYINKELKIKKIEFNEEKYSFKAKNKLIMEEKNVKAI